MVKRSLFHRPGNRWQCGGSAVAVRWQCGGSAVAVLMWIMTPEVQNLEIK